MEKSTRPTDVFRERLRAARESRGLSQGKLAERSGFKASAVSHFETGSRKPSFDNLKRLADALNVTTDYLLGRANAMEGASASTDKLHRHYSGLSTEYQEMADEFMQMLAEKTNKKKTKDG